MKILKVLVIGLPRWSSQYDDLGLGFDSIRFIIDGDNGKYVCVRLHAKGDKVLRGGKRGDAERRENRKQTNEMTT